MKASREPSTFSGPPALPHRAPVRINNIAGISQPPSGRRSPTHSISADLQHSPVRSRDFIPPQRTSAPPSGPQNVWEGEILGGRNFWEGEVPSEPQTLGRAKFHLSRKPPTTSTLAANLQQPPTTSTRAANLTKRPPSPQTAPGFHPLRYPSPAASAIRKVRLTRSIFSF